jgi:3'-phosphoadenosine 5'-phosphosulfate (PAPS) 3'-phosphatase
MPDTAAVAAAIVEAAQSEALPRFQNLQAHEIKEKTPGDLVTVADLATERALNLALAALLPGSVMVGEERGGGGKSRFAGGPAGGRGLLADRSHRWHHQLCPWRAAVRHHGGPGGNTKVP